MLDAGVETTRNVVGVIDIGSNSGRVMIFARHGPAHLRLLAGSRAPLRLVHDVDTRGELSDSTMARTTAAIRDFQAVATGAGATRIFAVATAAMRDASNGEQFAERLRQELGIRIEIINGLVEARYGFVGAVRGLAVSNGVLFDLGGGSLQISRFERRRVTKRVSLPFGALRISEKFLESDPPTAKQLRRLRDHVRSAFTKARVPRLADGDRLVGTGGTLRNLAKIDRQSRPYPIGGIHGYELSVERLGAVVERLASTRAKRRDDIPGLSAERADSIVGGAAAILSLATFVRARHILVSGHGVREGVALELLRIPLAAPATVKEASLSSLELRFDGWRKDTAVRRRDVAAALQRALEPHASSNVAMAIDQAARVLDIGRSLDAVNRHAHAADILLNTELDGFTHRELALVSAIVLRAGDRHADLRSLTPAIDTIELELIDRAAIILALADAIETRCRRTGRIEVACKVGRHVTVSVPSLLSWLVKDLDKRFERAFSRPLIVRR